MFNVISFQLSSYFDRPKFRFCGDGDCPDWALAEIYSSLSVLSSVKLKILTQMVAKSLLGEFIPDEKLRETFAANKTDLTPIKSSFACIRFLIVNAIRFNTDDATFNEELQQLGLPKEHSSAVCRVMSDHYQALKQYLIDTSLKINELESISCTIPNDVIDRAQLSFDISNEIVDGIPTKQSHKVNISKLDIGLLLNEMRTVRNLMEEMNYGIMVCRQDKRSIGRRRCVLSPNKIFLIKKKLQPIDSVMEL